MIIRDFGSACYSTTHSSHSFKLHNILHVPYVYKNILKFA